MAVVIRVQQSGARNVWKINTYFQFLNTLFQICFYYYNIILVMHIYIDARLNNAN